MESEARQGRKKEGREKKGWGGGRCRHTIQSWHGSLSKKNTRLLRRAIRSKLGGPMTVSFEEKKYAVSRKVTTFEA